MLFFIKLESKSFLFPPEHEQCYPEGLSVLAGLDKVSTEIQGLSSTDCNFQGLSRPWIFILNFKDFQSECEPCFSVMRGVGWGGWLIEGDDYFK